MEETLPAPRTPEEDDIVKLCKALNDDRRVSLFFHRKQFPSPKSAALLMFPARSPKRCTPKMLIHS